MIKALSQCMETTLSSKRLPQAVIPIGMAAVSVLEDVEQRDLISQSALLRHRRAIFTWDGLQEYVPVSVILEEPHIEVEEVIHCKDCRWYSSDSTCLHWGCLVRANGFCSEAKIR